MKNQILLIDDDDSFRKLLTLVLRSFLENAVFTEFDHLASARRFLKDKRGEIDFDLVVLDQHLPDGAGSDFIAEGWFEDIAVLSVSSDDAPEIPGQSITAGAGFFLSKQSISEPLFAPLVRGLIQRNRLMKELVATRVNTAVMDLIKTHIGTLRHEINNPLGAVLGAAYLLRISENATLEQREAAELVEKSGKRIKHVLDQICQAMELETPLQAVNKANQKVFHIPGDKPWDEEQ